MDSINHQMMGYDRAITMFSPDGRLLQVEYAKKTVKQGSTAVGMACSDGVLLVTDKRIVDPLVVTDAIEKIFQVDDHIGATASGIISDARVLIERAQLRAQQHRVTYDSPIDTLTIVKNICDLKQLCTQSGGLRPFGVSVLVAGIDTDGPKLFETDPTGIFFQYNAVVIGEGEEGIEEILHKKYKPSISVEDGLKLCVDALRTVLDDNFNVDRLDAAVIMTSDSKFRKVDRKELERVLKQAKA
jgi:proteasome alpha subunit